MKNVIKIIFLSIILASSLSAFSQKKTQIQLVRAQRLDYDEEVAIDVKRVIGDVVFEHDGAYLYCDSAWLYDNTNSVDAYGDVLIEVNDSVTITGGSLNYNGNTKIAIMKDSVVMKDRTTTLESDKITYNRNSEEAYYDDDGVVYDAENELISKIGIYNTINKTAYFKKDVVLTNPRYELNCDTLIYDTRTEIAYFPSVTRGKSNTNYMYCEDGWYDTQKDITFLRHNALVGNDKQRMSGDSIHYDQINDIGTAWNNVHLFDSVQNVILLGDYLYYNNLLGYAFSTDSAQAQLIEQSDTLYLHADTLRLNFDTTQTAEMLFAFKQCFFFREDLQGFADSLTYDFKDSIIYLHQNPVLWSEENQLKADTITIFLKNEEFHMIKLDNLAFISNELPFDRYNQIKGKNMIGYFEKNKLYKIDVSGNAESLYYIEENDGSLIGVNKTESAVMTLYIEDNEFTDILIEGAPKAVMKPWELIEEVEKTLKNFVSLAHLRPLTPLDIFLKSNKATRKNLVENNED